MNVLLSTVSQSVSLKHACGMLHSISSSSLQMRERHTNTYFSSCYGLKHLSSFYSSRLRRHHRAVCVCVYWARSLTHISFLVNYFCTNYNFHRYKHTHTHCTPRCNFVFTISSVQAAKEEERSEKKRRRRHVREVEVWSRNHTRSKRQK